MLNISPTSIRSRVDWEQFNSLRTVAGRASGNVLTRLLIASSVILLLILLLPWTQNIQGTGKVTTLRPDQRPQSVHSVIAGRIERWYIQEGDVVMQGDTILHLSEIKDEYFDPDLIDRTNQQIRMKELGIAAYREKVGALDGQLDALRLTQNLKVDQALNSLRQAQLVVTSDSTDYLAAVLAFDIAQRQFNRIDSLYRSGLKSRTEKEDRNVTMQNAYAKMISIENKFLASRNSLINARIELNSIEAQYQNAIARAQSERQTALSDLYDAEGTLTKLQNQLQNYSIRSGMYYVTAPQDGYVTRTIRSGLGETITAGSEIVRIMPIEFDLAVEMYIKPIDLPLLKQTQHVRLQFDGWPAVVFSGWPNTSYGTYGGEIYAIDNFISENGMFRVLIAPDPEDALWPAAIRVGTGAKSMVLLKNVPIWYELWRKINGFPPDYYALNDQTQATTK